MQNRTFVITEQEMPRLLRHPLLSRHPMLNRVLAARSNADRPKGKPCCGRRRVADTAVWRSLAAAALRRLAVSHREGLRQAALDTFHLPEDDTVRIIIGDADVTV